MKLYLFFVLIATVSCNQKKSSVAKEHNKNDSIPVAPVLSDRTAKFYADTAVFKKLHGGGGNGVMENEWIINGKMLRYGMPAVEIIPDQSKLDTMYFRENKWQPWDTIYFNVKEPRS